MANKKKISYKEAATELERIVEEIETEEIDVDVLTDKVKRAAWLIKTLRGKLRQTEGEVGKVLSGIEATGETEEADQPGNTKDSESNLF
jgi:exodeoxyribonuclease VII small subunit